MFQIKVKIPEGTQYGKQLRLKDKGMPILRKSSYGDLYIRIIPEVPVSLNKRQKELLEEFKELENTKLSPSIKTFFEKAKIHPNAHLIRGVVCGYRIEEIEDKFEVYKQCRRMEKLIDELAKGRKMEKILRQ